MIGRAEARFGTETRDLAQRVGFSAAREEKHRHVEEGCVFRIHAEFVEEHVFDDEQPTWAQGVANSSKQARILHRVEAMRDWLKTAEGCGCKSIDECRLFDAEEVDLPAPELTVIRR